MTNKKYFVIGETEALSKSDVIAIEKNKHRRVSEIFESEEQRKKELLTKNVNLKAPDGKVIIVIDIENKNWHTFENGQKIRLERQFDNLNRRQTEPVNCFVIDGKNIKSGSEILIHPNAIQDSNRIFDFKNNLGDIRYYSIPEEQCFCWRDEKNNWLPLPPYETALRVFKPYKGFLVGIEPEKLKNVLYVTRGELNGKCVSTINAVDYQIIFQDINGKENSIIRFRPSGCEKTKREPEAIAILQKETEQIKNGELLVGLTSTDAKPINEIVQNHRVC